MARGSYKAKESILSYLLAMVIIIVTFAAWVALILALVTSYVNPSNGWLFPIIGLLAPFIYLANIAIALYWVAQWRLWIALPIVVTLLLGLPKVSLIFKMPLKKDYKLESYKGCTKLLSYNIRGFSNDDGGWATKDIARYVEMLKPDIIAMQEYNEYFENSGNLFKRHISRYNKVQEGTMAIFSRYPILRHGSIYERTIDKPTGGSMWADILIGRDTLRLFNNHLQSTSVKIADEKLITASNIISDRVNGSKIHDMISRLCENAEERVKQSRTISAAIIKSPYPTVVCGDFNDTPISNTYYTIANGLQDAFVECGVGYTYTFRGFYNALRIDYILANDEVELRSYGVDRDVEYSDHLPVWSHLKIKQKI